SRHAPAAISAARRRGEDRFICRPERRSKRRRAKVTQENAGSARPKGGRERPAEALPERGAGARAVLSQPNGRFFGGKGFVQMPGAAHLPPGVARPSPEAGDEPPPDAGDVAVVTLQRAAEE